MANALIGFSGFVGSTLLRQTPFQALYRSNNISSIHGHSFNNVVCAGAPAQKWMANKDPENDLHTINTLISHLKLIQCTTFILISTVDVFQNPIEVDEHSSVDELDLHPYGLHRRHLEKFVACFFPNHLIVRLPGLVGPGLRKNIIFDFLNNNNLNMIDSRCIFQFYPMVNLWFDIQRALEMKLKLIHLTAEPIKVSDMVKEGFGKTFTQSLSNNPVRYDMRSRYASLFGASDYYQYSIRETIQAIRAYAQSEPCKIHPSTSVIL